MVAFLRIAAVTVGTSAFLAAATGVSAANGDPFTGMTYKEASSAVAEWGGTAVIQSVVGSRLPTDDCVITTWQKSSFRDIGGAARPGAILVNLNCNAQVATAGSPGNSVTSAAGSAAEKVIKTAEWCSEPEQATYADCATFCSAHDGMCTANF